jgi:hypothetical protein
MLQMMGKTGKGRPQFVIAIESSSAHSATLKFLASGDFIRKPMQAVGCVQIELFETRHISDFGRNLNQVASLQAQILH